jgi:very-short-patch-repair endonuclease
MDDCKDLDSLLRCQHFVITRRQALVCGVGHDAIRRKISPGGRWQRLLPGVYLAVTGTPTNDQRDIAALLYAGPGGTLTGHSALRRHGLRAPTTDLVNVLVPAKRIRQSMGFVLIHHTTRLPELVCYVGPVQYALPARAVGDAARELRDLRTVRAVLAAAVQTRKCTIEQLEAELKAGPVRGSALFRAALGEVACGARSSPEAELLRLITRGQLPVPMFNPSLYIGEEFLAKPDAWWPALAVAIEVDSKEWHLSPESWEQTMRRHDRMTAAGILVLHFTPRQIRGEPDQVLTTIRAALVSRRGAAVPAIRTIAAA